MPDYLTDEFSRHDEYTAATVSRAGLDGGAGNWRCRFFPIAASQWWLRAIIFAVLAIPLLCWPNLTSTYLLVGCGFFLLYNFRIGDTAGLRLATDLSDRPRAANAVGFVTSEPKVAPNGFATFLFKLESIEFDGKTRPPHATLLVRWRGNPEFGDELKMFGIAEPIAPPRNPGEFDMRSYLARQDVRRSLFVRYPEDGVLIRKGAGNPIFRAAQESRAWMRTAICRGLDDSPQVQNFLSGIALGLRHRTPEDIEKPFQQTGTLHLFAVAGLHVGIVARLLWILAMMARLSRKWATALIIPLLLFYAAVTGLHVSSIRAAVMSSILLGGFFFERKVFALNSLAAAASGECFAAHDRSRLRVDLSWRFGFSGGVARLAAIDLLVFSSDHTELAFANLVVVPIAFFILAIALLSLVVAPIA